MPVLLDMVSLADTTLQHVEPQSYTVKQLHHSSIASVPGLLDPNLLRLGTKTVEPTSAATCASSRNSGATEWVTERSKRTVATP